MKEKLKSLVINMFGGYLCALFVSIILQSAIFLLSWTGWVSLENLYARQELPMVFGLIAIASFIGGILMVIKARKEKDFLYTVFNPTKRKGAVGLVMFFLYIVVVYIISQGRVGTLNPIDFQISSAPGLLVLSMVPTYIYLYPFSAALEALIFSSKNEKLKNKKVWLVLIIFLFNPLIIATGYLNGMWMDRNQNIATGVVVPCGVQIMEVNKESPAEKAGLKKELVINKIDGREIKSIEEHLEFFNTLAGERTLNIEAGDKQYTVIPKKDETGKYKIGISVQTAYCKK